MSKEEFCISNWLIGVLAVLLLFFGVSSVISIGLEIDDQVEILTTYHKNLKDIQIGSLSLFDARLINGKIYSLKSRNVIRIVDGDNIYSFFSTDDTTPEEVKLGISLNDRFEKVLNPETGVLEQKLIRVKHEERIENDAVPYEFSYKPENRNIGKEIIINNPDAGFVVQKKYLQIYENDELVSEQLISSTKVKQSVEDFILGKNEGIPAFYEDVFTLESTAYTPTVAECDSDPTVCATGLKSGFGVVAVYPKQIPYYTQLYIEGYGYAIAGDCGGAIGPGRVDVFFYDKKSALKWGRRKVKVYVLGRLESIKK
ncbi:MAG: 3D domain-containing protein [Caldisericia bacterium]